MGRRPDPAGVAAQKAPVRSKRETKTPGANAAPDVPESGLKAPAWLKGEALEIWQRRAPMLQKARLLQAADELAFARYCRNFADWLKLRKALDTDGFTYETDSNHGKMRRSDPNFLIADRLERQLLAIEDRFGLNPAERQRLFLARATGKGGGGLFPEEPPTPARPDAAARAAPAATPSPPAGFLNKLN